MKTPSLLQASLACITALLTSCVAYDPAFDGGGYSSGVSSSYSNRSNYYGSPGYRS